MDLRASRHYRKCSNHGVILSEAKDLHAPRPTTQVERVRSTQSLVSILAECWRRPALIARELAWRWLFGLPALALLYSCAQRLYAVLTAANTGIEGFSLQRPVAAAQLVRAAYLTIAPAAFQLAAWVAPLLMLGWAVASGLGRAFVLRKLIPSSRLRPVSLCLLQLLRVSALALTVAAWFVMVRAAAARTIVDQPPGAEPAMVAFAAWLICPLDRAASSSGRCGVGCCPSQPC